MICSFLWAAKKYIHGMSLFLEYGANPNQPLPTDKEIDSSQTLLYNICAYTSGEPVEAAKLLLQYGADPLYPRSRKDSGTALGNARYWHNTPLITLYEKGGVQKLL